MRGRVRDAMRSLESRVDVLRCAACWAKGSMRILDRYHSKTEQIEHDDRSVSPIDVGSGTGREEVRSRMRKVEGVVAAGLKSCRCRAEGAGMVDQHFHRLLLSIINDTSHAASQLLLWPPIADQAAVRCWDTVQRLGKCLHMRMRSIFDLAAASRARVGRPWLV